MKISIAPVCGWCKYSLWFPVTLTGWALNHASIHEAEGVTVSKAKPSSVENRSSIPADDNGCAVPGIT